MKPNLLIHASDKDKKNRDDSRLVVVSGASRGYFRCIDRFLLSAARRGLHHRHRFIVYDLGLLASQRRLLMQFHPWCEWRDFDFGNYPAHIALSANSYAWKPIIVASLLEECSSQVFWLDSATLLHSDLSAVTLTLRQLGVYSLAGQIPLSRRCDHRTLTALGASPEILDQPERVTAVIGFDAKHPEALRIAREWRRQALVEDPMAASKHPVDYSHLDQTTLSVLLYQARLKQTLVLNDGEIDIGSANPVKWMSSHHKVADDLPRWADLPVRLGHSAYKWCDRIHLRMQRSVIRLIDGLWRLPDEHYCVMLQRKDEPPIMIKAPMLCYWADPFVIVYDDTIWILVESFDYPKARGRLLALQLDDQLAVKQKIQPIAFNHHASFPLMFKHAGHLYMIPETSQAKCIDLYRCENFPDKWQRVARLRDDIDAADSVVLFHAERWWLLTSVLKPGTKARQLCIFWSTTLEASHWTAHPMNEQNAETTDNPPQARAAGALVCDGDRWLRPVQINPHYYGESMQIMQIDHLDEHRYAESVYRGTHSIQQTAQNYPAHHVDINNDIKVWDVRDRRRWFDLFRTPANCRGLPNPPFSKLMP
jgi:hypothetical protein